MKKYSFVKSFFVITLLISLSSVFIVSFLWIVDEFIRFNNQAKIVKEDYINDQMIFLKKEVNRVFDYIGIQRSKIEKRTMEEVKTRVNEACNIAEHLYNFNKGRMSNREIESIVREALREIRFFSGRGYFFAIAYNGIEMLFTDQPQMEGLDLRYLQDENGQYVIVDMLELAKEKGEGFYEYLWTKPESDRNDHKKIAYIKAVPGLNWVIGSGGYPEDVEKDIQKEILEYLATVRIDEAGYIFGGQFDGISILGPAVNRNMLEIQDSNGVFIVKELINAAGNGGGYVEYVMPEFENTEPLPKISYARGISEWNWYLGFGVYVYEIDEYIAETRTDLIKEIYIKVFSIVLIFVIVFLAVLFISRIFSKQFRKEYDIFFRFYESSVSKNKLINLDSLKFDEFSRIAELSNNMVEKKRESDKELMETLEERSFLLREVHHRVKNNFQAIASLFDLQALNTDNQKTIDFLREAKNRIYSMAAVHELLYKSANFGKISFRNYLEKIIKNIFSSISGGLRDIKTDLEIQDLVFSIEDAVPIGLILNELVTNTCKHAFPENHEGKLAIKMYRINDEIVIEYMDNGIGVTEEMYISKKHGFGFQVIDILLTQIDGVIDCKKENGFHCTIRIQAKEDL